jgi:hypothetical protein
MLRAHHFFLFSTVHTQVFSALQRAHMLRAHHFFFSFRFSLGCLYC